MSRGGDFDGEFTGRGGDQPPERSVVLKQIPQQTDGKEKERGLSAQGLCLPSPSEFHLSVHFGEHRDSPRGTVPGHPHLLLCVEEEEETVT